MITNGGGLGFHLYRSNILLPYTALHCLNRTVIQLTIMDFLFEFHVDLGALGFTSSKIGRSADPQYYY